jgi:hypothetical protein
MIPALFRQYDEHVTGISLYEKGPIVSICFPFVPTGHNGPKTFYRQSG